MRLSAGMSRSASAPSLAKVSPAAAAPVPGVSVLVSKVAAKSPLSASAAAASVAQPPQGTALLRQLQSADLPALVDTLLKASPSAAEDMQPLLIRAFGEELAEVSPQEQACVCVLRLEYFLRTASLSGRREGGTHRRQPVLGTCAGGGEPVPGVPGVGCCAQLGKLSLRLGAVPRSCCRRSARGAARDASGVSASFRRCLLFGV